MEKHQVDLLISQHYDAVMDRYSLVKNAAGYQSLYLADIMITAKSQLSLWRRGFTG